MFRYSFEIFNPIFHILKLLCMKKLNTLLHNENVVATIVIAAVFLITGLITVWAILRS